MDAETRAIAADLRKRSSKEIADWLISNYPVGSPHSGRALVLLDHVTVRKADARRLAYHYLSQLPHAHDTAYKIFSKLLGPDELIAVARSHLPEEQSQRDLLLYHLLPILHGAARSPEHEDAMRQLLEC